MQRRTALLIPIGAGAALAACSSPGSGDGSGRSATGAPASSDAGSSATPGASTPSGSGSGAPSSVAPATGRLADAFTVAERGTFEWPWALSFLPGTDALAITLRPGGIKLRDQKSGQVHDVAGAPQVVAEDQGGMGDLVPAPSFAKDGTVYLSWVRGSGAQTQAVVGRARLDVPGRRLEGLTVVWQQDPAEGSKQFSQRIAFQGGHLWVSSGDRFLKDPAQDLTTNLGKILRLTMDGTPAVGNPFADRGGRAAEVWSWGHRNPLGIAFDRDGRLWESEMGPKGGDEVNLITEGGNYGWPKASNGSNYDGSDIPDHRLRDGFVAPKVSWNPSVSPGSLMIYSGSRFPDYRGDAFLGALSGQALIRVRLQGENAQLANTWQADARIRAVATAPDGSIWLAQDASDAKLLQLTPRG